MAVDAFDTFEYDKAPDYLPGFDRRVAEEDASRKLIEAQMKENDQQREANIKIGANNLKAIQDLAPKAAKLYAQHQQEQDKKFQAKAKMLLQMSGFDQWRTKINLERVAEEERLKFRDLALEKAPALFGFFTKSAKEQALKELLVDYSNKYEHVVSVAREHELLPTEEHMQSKIQLVCDELGWTLEEARDYVDFITGRY